MLMLLVASEVILVAIIILINQTCSSDVIYLI
jgi:hypothetical protein